MQHNLIHEAIQRVVLNEAEKEKQVSSEKIDKMIRGVRDKLEDINVALVNSGLPKESKPVRQLKRMYQILASFDPVSVKMNEFMQEEQTGIQSAAAEMVGETIQISVDADKKMKDTAADYSTEYETDVELQNDDD